jgi:hypothetical protein
MLQYQIILYSQYRLDFYALYSTLLHLPPLRFHVCWNVAGM